MGAVEFVNDAEARAHAESAVVLMASAETKRGESYAADLEACFELQAVADLIGPESNTGVRGITWFLDSRRGRGVYAISAKCRDGHVRTTLKAPSTLEEALDPTTLQKAVDALARKVDAAGGVVSKSLDRPKGTGDALVEAVASSEPGLAWLATRANPRAARACLLSMVKVAERYGRNGVNPQAGLTAHLTLSELPDCAELIRAHPTRDGALAAAARRRGKEPSTSGASRRRVPVTARQQLMRRAGLSPEAAQALLSLLLNNETSLLALKRAVKSLPALLAEIEGNESRVEEAA